MRFLTSWLWPVVKFICVSSIGGGILLWMGNVFDLHPDKWVADVLGLLATPENLWAVTLILAGSFGLLAPMGWTAIARWRTTPESPAHPPASDSSSARFIDEYSVKLAGITGALMERALRHGFQLPLSDGDRFLQQWDTLENSDHPIWTNKDINQLRREFLHHVGLVGSSRKLGMSLKESEDDRRQLESFGRQLIEKLTGVQSSDDEHSAWTRNVTRFPIWQAACYIHDVPLEAYKQSSAAQSKASELVYYSQQGLINLAGETDEARNIRIMAKQNVAIDEQTYLGRETVEEIKKNGLSSWLSTIDQVNNERRILD